MSENEQSQHTTGHWKVSLNITGRGQYVRPQGAGYVGIIENEDIYIAEVGGETEAQCLANARLVAAAPELLAACKSFVALWPVLEDRNEPKATPEVISVWHQAIATINKAEGRA